VYRDERLYRCPRWYLEAPEDYQMLFPLELLNCVVFLGERTARGIEWKGTGFLVGIPHQSDGEKRHVLLFTAEHCVGTRTGLVARVNGPGGAPRVMDLPSGPKWYRYPKEFLTPPEDAVDLAATLIPTADAEALYVAGHRWVSLQMFLEDHSETEPAPPQTSYPPLQWTDEPSRGIGVGDEVVAFGLLRVFTGTERNRPIARTGNIAMQGHDVLQIRRKNPDKSWTTSMMRLYLTEVRSIQGESGSPVFVKIRQNVGEHRYQVALLGLLIGHWVDREDDESLKENLGIGQVVPAFRMEGLMQQKDLRDECGKAEDQDDGPEAVADSAQTKDSIAATAGLMHKLLQVPPEEAAEVHESHRET
jgi:hypothetical protein